MPNLPRGLVAGGLVILGVILLLTIAACSTDDQPGEDNGTSAPDSGGSEMRLTANGCAADCTFANDEEFTLAVEIVGIPGGGYIGVQSVIDFGADLTSNAAAAADEIVWPDCEPAIALSDLLSATLINHGCLSGLLQPLPVSTYAGTFVELSVTCSPESSKTEVRLLPEEGPDARPGGAAFMGTDAITRFFPEITDVTIICGD